MRRLPAIAAALALASLAGAAGGSRPGVRQVWISVDPPRNGQQVLTVRMAPSVTSDYEMLLFRCSLHQEFAWRGTDGKETIRKIDPATFEYRERDVKMVQDLDKYVSFRVPVDLDELRRAYGRTTFATNAPVTISRVKVTAMAGGNDAWSFESPVGESRTFE